MKQIFSILLLAGLFLVAGNSCLSSKKAQSESPEENAAPIEESIVPDTFVLPRIPEKMTDPEERAQYLVMHFWDRFDFNNRNLVQKPEITEQAFVDYINILAYVPKEKTDASLAYTLKKAETDTTMYLHFTELFEKYFYEPNSPFRNDEYYLSVLQEIMKSSILTSDEKSRYGFQLEMAQKNRVGQKANDFTYTISSGQSLKLYDLQSEYTLVMFTDPGCSTCAEATYRLNNSKDVNNALNLNAPGRTMLTIIAIASDSDLAEWSAHLTEIPARWVYAYDKNKDISKKKLYDIKAYPTLYLLDKDKKVILKDTTVEAIESFFAIPR